MESSLLRINDLHTYFYTEYGVVKAVNGSSFNLEKGETLGIVGESGSGKTVTALSVLDLIENPGRIVNGEIIFKGENLVEKSEKHLQHIRGKEIAMVFQDSLSSLNPTMTVGNQIERVLHAHTSLKKNERYERTVELLRLMNIPEPAKRVGNYPHELSGGMRQRILIAMAISCNPDIIILDEPTTALDVTIEAQILEVVEQLKSSYHIGIIMITHDLSVVANSCNRVIIMYAGHIVEEAPVEELYEDPLHPYTIGLLKSIPQMEQKPKTKLFSIPGEVPDLIGLGMGCNFYNRCEYAEEICRTQNPTLIDVSQNHRVSCLRLEEIHAAAAH